MRDVAEAACLAMDLLLEEALLRQPVTGARHVLFAGITSATGLPSFSPMATNFTPGT